MKNPHYPTMEKKNATDKSWWLARHPDEEDFVPMDMYEWQERRVYLDEYV